MDIDIKKLGKRVTEKRTELGWSITQLADKCGLSRSYVSLVEHGGTSASLKVFVIIANTLKVRISWLMGEDDSSHVFPNGMTYEEMNEKLKNYEILEKALKGLK
jgi:transcriptional regulator with XRE-family HTH domain